MPANIPQLLANGCTGIAVGMATNIPPHNLKEVCDAAVALIDDKDLETKDLLKYVKGPDFPTGGLVTNSKKELRDIYETGQGGIRVRGEWKTEQEKRGGERMVITSIPFGISKATLVEKIAEVIIAKKLPLLLDVRDESTSDVRIVLELKAGADAALVMSYLYKHTPLELGFHVNMTCLVPTANPEIAGPARLDLKAILPSSCSSARRWSPAASSSSCASSRSASTSWRASRSSSTRWTRPSASSASRTARPTPPSSSWSGSSWTTIQADAVLELKLYKLARLEIDAIRSELAEKRARAKEIRAILADKKKLWKVIRGELVEVERDVSPTSGAPRSAVRAATTSRSTPRRSSSTRRSR